LLALLRLPILEAAELTNSTCDESGCDAQDEISVEQYRVVHPAADVQWMSDILEGASAASDAVHKGVEAPAPKHTACLQFNNSCISACKGNGSSMASQPRSNFGQNIEYSRSAFVPRSVKDLEEYVAASMHHKDKCFLPVNTLHS